jgi:hypothetical protein
MRAVIADCDRGLRAPDLGMFHTRGFADRTAAIPLRHSAARGSAEDDDTQHQRLLEMICRKVT